MLELMDLKDEIKPFPAVRYPFHPGDRLDQKTFHRLYKKCPDWFRAELIGGVVYFKMPTSMFHSQPHSRLIYWLETYASRLPGCTPGVTPTTQLGLLSEPEPDAVLYMERGAGGRCRIDRDGFLEGAPELIVEIAYSTVSMDLGQKKEDYEKCKVDEYLVINVQKKNAVWFVRARRKFVELPCDHDGYLKSKVFPGLWVKPRDFFAKTGSGLLAGLNQARLSGEFIEFQQKLAAFTSDGDES